jgi:hypothetical protein
MGTEPTGIRMAGVIEANIKMMLPLEKVCVRIVTEALSPAKIGNRANSSMVDDE